MILSRIALYWSEGPARVVNSSFRAPRRRASNFGCAKIDFQSASAHSCRTT